MNEVQELPTILSEDNTEATFTQISGNVADRYTIDEYETIKTAIREKYPNEQLYHVFFPWVGHYVFKAQDMSDVKEISKRVDDFINSKIDELGGEEKINSLPESERIRISRQIDLEAGEISNMVSLIRSIVYPLDFEELAVNDRLKSGVIPKLLDEIMSKSGWGNIEVKEI